MAERPDNEGPGPVLTGRAHWSAARLREEAGRTRQGRAEVHTPERPPTRAFMEVQNDLIALIDQTPDPQREEELIIERARIIRDAQDAGVLEEIERSIANILASPVDFVNAGYSMMMVNVANLERNARHRPEYEARFDGMIDEYRRAMQLAMSLAYNTENYRMHGRPRDARLLRLQRETSLVCWIEHPEFYGKARQNLQDDQRELAKMNLPANLAGRGSYVEEFYSPIGLRKRFVEAEADCDSPDLVPQNSLFYEGLSPEEKPLWQARVGLAVARARKQQTFTPDKLFPNPELMNLTTGGLNRLESMPGVAEASAIYTVFSTQDCRAYGGEFAAMISSMEVFRNGKAGIGCLLDIQSEDELSTFRQMFKEYLARRFGITIEQARDAEQVAFNKNFVSGLPDFANSEYFQKGGRRNPDSIPKSVSTNAMRELCHPLDKAWYDSAAKSTPRVWPPNIMGEWIVAHRAEIQKHIARRKDGGDEGDISDIIPLPRTLYRDALHTVEIIPGTSLYDHMAYEGYRLLAGQQGTARKIPWGKMGETPFLGYNLDLGRAVRVWIAYDRQQVTGEPGTPEQFSSDVRKYTKVVGEETIGVDARAAEALLYLLYDQEIKKSGSPGLYAGSRRFIPDWGLAIAVNWTEQNMYKLWQDQMPQLFAMSGLKPLMPRSVRKWI
jgi:hypothetical protein